MGNFKKPPHRGNQNRREEFLNHDPERAEQVEPESSQSVRGANNPLQEMKMNKTIRIKIKHNDALRLEVDRLWAMEGKVSNASAIIEEALEDYFRKHKVKV